MSLTELSLNIPTDHVANVFGHPGPLILILLLWRMIRIIRS